MFFIDGEVRLGGRWEGLAQRPLSVRNEVRVEIGNPAVCSTVTRDYPVTIVFLVLLLMDIVRFYQFYLSSDRLTFHGLLFSCLHFHTQLTHIFDH